MENFYKDMTYLAVYDGHGSFGKVASELANNSIKEYLESNKEALYALDSEEDMTKFFKKMYIKVQEKFKGDVRLRTIILILEKQLPVKWNLFSVCPNKRRLYVHSESWRFSCSCG